MIKKSNGNPQKYEEVRGGYKHFNTVRCFSAITVGEKRSGQGEANIFLYFRTSANRGFSISSQCDKAVTNPRDKRPKHSPMEITSIWHLLFHRQRTQLVAPILKQMWNHFISHFTLVTRLLAEPVAESLVISGVPLASHQAFFTGCHDQGYTAAAPAAPLLGSNNTPSLVGEWWWGRKLRANCCPSVWPTWYRNNNYSPLSVHKIGKSF